MKFSTILAIAAVSLAFVSTGCRYNKSGAGAGAGDGDGSISDINGEITEGDDINAIAGRKSFADLYRKCTDVSFDPVYFGFDSTVVPQGELGKIDAVASHLREHSDRVVSIEGNCDERGSNEYNVSLGMNRAIIIRNYLVQNDIAADRIETVSAGEEKPAVDGHDESAWARNRRGEFTIFQK